MQITQPKTPISNKLSFFSNLMFNITIYNNLYMEVEFNIILYHNKNKWEKDLIEVIDGVILKSGNIEINHSQSSELIKFYKDVLKKDIWKDIEDYCSVDINREVDILINKLNSIKW